MENQQILDTEFTEAKPKTLHSPLQFAILSIATFGLYEIWWFYQAWRYYKEKENLDIMPVWRAIFSIFFVYSLFEKTLRNAKEKDYREDYSPASLTIAYIALYFLAHLPDPYWLISFLGLLPVLPAVSAYNYAVSNDTSSNIKITDAFSLIHIVLLIAGLIIWALVLIGLFADDPALYMEQ